MQSGGASQPNPAGHSARCCGWKRKWVSYAMVWRGYLRVFSHTLYDVKGYCSLKKKTRKVEGGWWFGDVDGEGRLWSVNEIRRPIQVWFWRGGQCSLREMTAGREGHWGGDPTPSLAFSVQRRSQVRSSGPQSMHVGTGVPRQGSDEVWCTGQSSSRCCSRILSPKKIKN